MQRCTVLLGRCSLQHFTYRSLRGATRCMVQHVAPCNENSQGLERAFPYPEHCPLASAPWIPIRPYSPLFSPLESGQKPAVVLLKAKLGGRIMLPQTITVSGNLTIKSVLDPGYEGSVTLDKLRVAAQPLPEGDNEPLRMP